ncbi:MAG: GNAT family N-acetyltransferase [Bacteroidales bacterium]|nr:GNAT family N-acetyltransferase [Bacteroidales bacterium]
MKEAVKNKILLRDATPEDAPLIAWAVLTAMDFKEEDPEFKPILENIKEACLKSDTLYSYKRTRIAVIANTNVGCLVSYDGAFYTDHWRNTWKAFGNDESDQYTEEYLKSNAIETQAGEWYLDSMSISAAFRGFGIGHFLMEDAIAIAKRKGFHKVTLIVEKEKAKLKEYYMQLGFKDEKELVFFGHDYYKMALDI